MKNHRILLVLLLGLAPSSNAANLLRGPRAASLVGQALTHDKKEMPVTTHKKGPGDGYKKGSPLFKKQQEREADGKATTPPDAPKGKVAAPVQVDDSGLTVTLPPKDQAMDPQHWWHTVLQAHKEHALRSFVTDFIITMLIALIWTKCTSPGRTRRGYDERKNTPGMGFALADTYAKEPFPLITSFWTALVIVTLLLTLSQLTFGFTYSVFLVLAVYFRNKMRKQYGLETGAITCIGDIFTWFLCPVCATAQEARQLEFVKKPNDPVK